MYFSEDFSKRQVGLPEKVLQKTYVGADADNELDEDLGELLDQRKFVELSEDGRAYWTVMPNETTYHVSAVEANQTQLEKSSNGLLIKEQPIFFRSDEPGKKKYPDVAVWGSGRLRTKDGKLLPNTVVMDGANRNVNPDVVIEFSWSNTLLTETTKLNVEMNHHFAPLLPIQFGILIKTRPKSGYDLPVEGSRDHPPLGGFDVYFVEQGGTAGRQPNMTYRFGTPGDENKEIVVGASKLSGGGGFRIRLAFIKQWLIDECLVVFEA